jgi:NAD(P)-dependent dehydrogenase (short-subunit alcohol dehydrogenase family)
MSSVSSQKGSGRLDGKRIVVTGGATGLGAAIVERIVTEGGAIVIADINNDAGEALAAKLGQYFFSLDVTSESQWQKLAQYLTDSGGFNGLVNNAGLADSKSREDIEGIDIDDLHRIFSVNVDGVTLGCKHLIPVLAKSGGSIVNLSSIAALVPTEFLVSYGASKAAVAHITRSVARHCANLNYRIRVNSLHPGQVNTPMLDKIKDRMTVASGLDKTALNQELLSRIPLGEWQEEIDIANGALFFLSDESRFVTGTQLVVDGGMSLTS